jgi:hypothetical protein
MSQAAEETLPLAIAKHTTELGLILDRHFDTDRAGNVQSQIVALTKRTIREQWREALAGLFDPASPLEILKADVATSMRDLTTGQAEVLQRLAALNERITGSKELEAERERGTAKGRAYEEAVGDALESALAPFQDVVVGVGSSQGSDGRKSGDLVVTINTDDTEGRDLRFAVEAKCKKLSLPAALRELDDIMSNREAEAGVLIFASAAQAPLRGQSFRAFSGARIMAVYDLNDGNTLALEVASHLARALAIRNALKNGGPSDAERLKAAISQLARLIEDSQGIIRGANAARRGIDQIEATYSNLRGRAIEVISGIEADG